MWENQVSTHAATLAAKPSSGWHVWMICRCLTVLPVTAGLVHFVFTPVCGRCGFFSGPGANTWVCQPDTPAFWMLVAVISGMGGKFHTNHVFPVVCIFPRKPTEDTGREARRTVDDRLPQCRRRDGGTSCQGGVAAWPSASRSSLSILPQTRFAVPSGRTETCAHCRDRRNFPDRGPSWSLVPRSRRESSTQQPAVNVAFLPTALPRAGGGCCHQRPLSKR